MNLNDIMNGNKPSNAATLAAIVDRGLAQTSISRGAGKISQGRYTLKKLKMEEGDGLMVVPVMIHLPIDYSGQRLAEPTPYMGTFAGAIATIKMLNNSNARYAEELKMLLGDSYDKINFNNLVEVSADEREIFRPFRRVLVYAATVMSVKAADSKTPYGTPYRVEGIAFDPDTKQFIDSPKNPIAYKLHKLETAIIATKVKEINEKNLAAGDARRTDQEIASTVKALWENRCISNPYSLGTTRILFFKTNRDFLVNNDTLKNWSPEEAGIKANEFYIKINRNILDRLNQQMGTRYDRYDDFLLIKQSTPAFTDATRGTAAQQISRQAAGSEEAIEAQLKDFLSAYAAYRNNLDTWDEKIILRCAFEYRTINDDSIRTIFMNSVPELTSALSTAEIAEQFSDTIASLDSKLSDTLMEGALTGSLKSSGDISAEIKSAPVVDENVPGYGGDSVGADVAADAAEMAAALIGE